MMYYKKNNELIDLKDYLPIEKVEVGVQKNPFVNTGNWWTDYQYFKEHSTAVKVIDDFVTKTDKSMGLIIPAGHFIIIENWNSDLGTPNPPDANYSFVVLSPINKEDYACPMKLGFGSLSGDVDMSYADEAACKVLFYGLIPSKAVTFNDAGDSFNGTPDLSIAQAAIYRYYDDDTDDYFLTFNAWYQKNPVFVASGNNHQYGISIARFKITLYKWNEE